MSDVFLLLYGFACGGLLAGGVVWGLRDRQCARCVVERLAEQADDFMRRWFPGGGC